jgi:N-acyl-D-amino-acid deacylase
MPSTHCRSLLPLGVSVAIIGLALVALSCARPSAHLGFDVVIEGGLIVDGTGAPSYRGDVGIVGDRIQAIGRLQDAPARSRIRADGLVVAPGFIDMLGQSEFSVLVDTRAASKILQGVTTEVTGEGSSIAPVNDQMAKESEPLFKHFGVVADWRTMADYFKRLDTRTHPALNIAMFVGADGLRTYVIGKDDRRATREELDQMKSLAAKAMEEGALGVSSALQYVPGRFANTDELAELASVAARYGGIYITHQRSESGLIFQSLDEVITIAERAQVPAEIWHLKTAYRANWGKMPEVLAHIEAARARGIDLTANQYPYTRASNGLDACLPLWVREGGLEKMLARLRDPAERERAKKDMEDGSATTWENQWYGSGGGDGVMLASVLSPELRKYEGMTLTAIGKDLGKDPREVVMDFVIADRGQSSVIISIMSEDDVRSALKHPLVSVCTDSEAKAEDGPMSESKSHPRAWGTFPRILGKYVRDEHLLTIEEAVRKMTSQPATRVHLNDRGILRPGMAADVTVFDPATIRDVATFEDPNHYSIGVKYVLVNGQVVVSDGKITDQRPGRPLRGPGYRPPSPPA